MQKKPTTPSASTAVTTETTQAEVRQALATGSARLSAAEEKALRMRFGAGAPGSLVLERVGQSNPEARERLLGIELELLRQAKARAAASAVQPKPVAVAAAPAPANPRRDRIVEALRKKK
jgi:DNA-directed RNA polymerase sigma subunit (sigma70/sigma32)